MKFWNHLTGHQKRVGLLGGSALFFISLIFLVFRPQPIPVDFAVVSLGDLEVSVSDEGQTRVKEVYTVSAPIAGRVLRIDADVGDLVRAYQTAVASIQPTSPSFLDIRTRAQAEAAVKVAEAALTLAQAEVARALAEFEFAQSELRRADSLFKRGNVSESARDRAQLEVKTKESALRTTEAALRVKEFELETARASLIDPGNPETPGPSAESCCIPIYAPVDGRILQILHQSEGVVAAGTPLIEVGDPRELEVVVDLLSTDAVQVRPGAEAYLENWGGDDVLVAKVLRVEPFGFTKVSALGVEEQRVNVVLDITDLKEKWSLLGHGFRVEARIVTWREQNILTVPIGALFRDQGKQAVFVVAQGRAQLRQIDVGQMNDRNAQVLGGLEEGDVVIMHPSDLIFDGVAVTSRQDGTIEP